jgi:hypothetical protein
MATRTEKASVLVARPMVAALPEAPAHVGQLLLPARAPLPAAKRLVVLVPAGLIDETALAQHIWSIAQARGLSVLYVSRTTRVEDEPSLRRRLALLAALTRDTDCVRADSRLAVGNDWLALIRAVGQPGDLVVCHAEQQAPLLSLGRPIGQTLADTLGTPVYLLSGYCEPEASQLARLGRQLLFWIGALVIGAGFFWIQVNVQRLTQDWMQTVVLVLTVLIEFGLLAAWSHRLQ